MKKLVVLSLATSLCFYLSLHVEAQSSSTRPASGLGLRLERVATGLTRPVFGTYAPGDPSKMYVVESRLGSNGGLTDTNTDTGQIRVLDLTTGVLSPTPFLQISGLANGNEQGLLGLAFHPDYQNNGKFYVNYTSKAPGSANSMSTTRIVEYTATDPFSANVASARPILNITQAPYSNHKGGWMGFGPDNFLYIATGDGGGANDPGNRAQDITEMLLGKILRINVNADDFLGDPNRNYAIPTDNPFVGITGDDEIYAFGLRNPWRNSFDRLTGDLYIADVGQGRWEEINVKPANLGGGQNYGWDLREGAHNADGTAGNALPSAINPILDYAHNTSQGGTDAGLSITGGYVYRGPISELQGQYFYADYVSRRLWSLQWNGVTPTNLTSNNLYTNLTEWTNDMFFQDTSFGIEGYTSFGEDLVGNLYIFDMGGNPSNLASIQGRGEIYRISAVPEPSGVLLLAASALTLSRRRSRRRFE